MSKKIEKKNADARPDFALNRQNYMLMGVGFLIIIIGFALMIGDTDIYDFRKTILADVVVLAGFIFEIYAIMKPAKED